MGIKFTGGDDAVGADPVLSRNERQAKRGRDVLAAAEKKVGLKPAEKSSGLVVEERGSTEPTSPIAGQRRRRSGVTGSDVSPKPHTAAPEKNPPEVETASAVVTAKSETPVKKDGGNGSDRRAWMRDYMRDYRAGKRRRG